MKAVFFCILAVIVSAAQCAPSNAKGLPSKHDEKPQDVYDDIWEAAIEDLHTIYNVHDLLSGQLESLISPELFQAIYLQVFVPFYQQVDVHFFALDDAVQDAVSEGTPIEEAAAGLKKLQTEIDQDSQSHGTDINNSVSGQDSITVALVKGLVDEFVQNAKMSKLAEILKPYGL